MSKQRVGQSTRRSRSHAGFTLVELLVAMTVTVLLVLFINNVFRSISDGVRTGLATSEIVQTGRVISEQFATDGDRANMRGPDQNGVLVITNQRILAPFTADDPDPLDLDPADQDIYERRADQLMFIRRSDNLESMTPVGSGDFTPSSAFTAGHARVWYGHALRTMPEGDDDGFAQLGFGRNAFAAQWVLGRQALLLSSDVGSGQPYAQGGWWYAPLSGWGSTNIPPDVEQSLYTGLVDVAAYGFENENPDLEYGAMVGEMEPDSDEDIDQWARLYLDLPYDDSGDPETDPDSAGYATRALYYTYADERLRVNPEPFIDLEDDTTPWRYGAWQMAQMQPMLARGVTDFIVEFAGDYDQQNNNAGRIDVEPNTGEIIWYGDGNPPPNFNVIGGGGTGTAGPQGPIHLTDEDVNGDPFEAFIFRHGPAEETNWPYLIRIRYRVTDPRGQLMDADGVPGRMYEQIIRVNRSEEGDDEDD